MPQSWRLLWRSPRTLAKNCKNQSIEMVPNSSHYFLLLMTMQRYLPKADAFLGLADCKWGRPFRRVNQGLYEFSVFPRKRCSNDNMQAENNCQTWSPNSNHLGASWLEDQFGATAASRVACRLIAQQVHFIRQSEHKLGARKAMSRTPACFRRTKCPNLPYFPVIAQNMSKFIWEQ